MIKSCLVIITVLLAALVIEFYSSEFIQYQWEYKVVRIENNALGNTGALALAPSSIPLSEIELELLGTGGWELAGCYVETETAYPNFGNEDYHTGIKPNVRSSQLVLIFKKSLKGN